MKCKISLHLIIMVCLILMGPVNADAQKKITFWTTEDEQARMKIQKDIAHEFTQKTGINVQIVPVKENRLAEKVTAAFAAKSLPDVIFHPMEFTVGWAEAGVLDIESPTQVVEQLGIDTFGSGPLNLVRVPKGYAGLPLDGWGQLLLYRKDLFKEKGLLVPDKWENILKQEFQR